MKMLKRIKILVFILMVTKIDAQEAYFDFALNLANIGWGMEIGNNKYHQINFNFFNFFIENTNSNIGIELSPFHSWFNINSTDLISFFNLSLYYNLSNDWNESERIGSNYTILGAICYLKLCTIK
jgi:hypothetical protein